MRKITFPILYKRGLVKIYSTPDGNRPAFTVSWLLQGKRIRRKFHNLKRAKAEAENVAVKIEQGRLDELRLTGKDRDEYLRSKSLLKPSGLRLETVAANYAEALDVLGKDSVLEACRFFAHRNLHSMPDITVQVAVEDIIGQAETDSYRNLLRSSLKPFSDAFHCQVKSLVARDINQYLKQLKLAPRTKKNIRDCIQAMIRHCIKQGWLPKDFDVMESVTVFSKKSAGEIEVFTALEISKLLSVADDDSIPALAIAAFAGIRRAEIERLDWSQIDLVEGFIEVKARQAKTRSRRLIPILDNLREWLNPIARKEGLVTTTISNRYQKLSKLSGVKWKKNALRHSFISYRIALIHDINQVANECGNSPSIIHTNYREVVRPAEAKAWFAISPIVSGKVVSISKISEAS